MAPRKPDQGRVEMNHHAEKVKAEGQSAKAQPEPPAADDESAPANLYDSSNLVTFAADDVNGSSHPVAPSGSALDPSAEDDGAWEHGGQSGSKRSVKPGGSGENAGATEIASDDEAQDEAFTMKWRGMSVLHMLSGSHWTPRIVMLMSYQHVPAIRVWYRRLPSGAEASELSSVIRDYELSESAMPDVTSRNVQKIAIYSNLLNREFDKYVTREEQDPWYDSMVHHRNRSNIRPLILGPPFKVLFEFLPNFQRRRDELEAKFEMLYEEAKKKYYEEAKMKHNEEARKMHYDGNEEMHYGETREMNKGGRPPQRPEKPGQALEGAYLKRAARIMPDGERNKMDSDLLDVSVGLDHIDLLHHLIHVHLAEVLELRSAIASGSLRSIAFEDLWHLFRPGDVVVSTLGGPGEQLFRVYAVTGGQATLKRPAGAVHGSTDNYGTYETWTYQNTVMLGEQTDFRVDAYAMHCDGTRFGPVCSSGAIKPYKGLRDILDLDMYPLKFHPRMDEILARAEARGRKTLASYGHKLYNGPARRIIGQIVGNYDISKGAVTGAMGSSAKELESDVFIDLEMFYSLDGAIDVPMGKFSRSKPNINEVRERPAMRAAPEIKYVSHEVDAKLSDQFLAANRNKLDIVDPDKATITADQLILLPSYTFGYAFRFRCWMYLEIDSLEDINHHVRGSRFNDLVIPRRYRDLLVALVDNHTSTAQRWEKHKPNDGRGSLGTSDVHNQIDLVKGKGQGIIVLLHGPPGSGKTSTAETIAAYTRRPLYSITCGDIGLEPVDVERNLRYHTEMAEKWGCVLLLDEADVFLMQREWQDMKRNALVSIFLRELEYYSGILFLTTNRPGVIDEAFKSRMHVTLRYPGVNLESTKTMWANIMRNIDEENASSPIRVVFDADALLSFAERHYILHEHDGTTWNGRQIRNAFRTAIALGHYERMEKLRSAGMSPEQAEQSGKKKWMTVRLTKRNFANIAKTSHDFEEYIVHLRGRDSDNVKEAEVRDDHFHYRFELDDHTIGSGSGGRHLQQHHVTQPQGRYRSASSTPMPPGKDYAAAAAAVMAAASKQTKKKGKEKAVVPAVSVSAPASSSHATKASGSKAGSSKSGGTLERKASQKLLEDEEDDQDEEDDEDDDEVSDEASDVEDEDDDHI